jgi:DNA repair exonuclease SbcCD ATPase subunit
VREIEGFVRIATAVRRELDDKIEPLINGFKDRETSEDYRRNLQVCLECIDVFERDEAFKKKRDVMVELRLKVNLLRERETRKRDIDVKIRCIWNKLTTLKTVSEAFASFKDWVLEHSVLPLIEGNVNRLLEMMCRNHRPLALKYRVDGGDLLWSLRDTPINMKGAHEIPLEKGSGFQKSVTGLAMRIVLGRLGFAGIRNTQLFIDEGFTSCDADNLVCVPEVLGEMLGMYETIVIVTHLEELHKGVRSVVEVF